MSFRSITLFVPLLGISACRSSDVPAPQAPEESALDVPDANPSEEPPALVLWLTVDQMRGDYLEKYSSHFGEDGLKKLLRRSASFSSAHYRHAITETAPGHATLFTGASPRIHGIIGNSWLLLDGTDVASVTDEKVVLLGPGLGNESPDPTAGRSPHRLSAETIGDALIRQTDGKARVVAVSSKDRGAILTAGQKGKAYWLGPVGFVSSTFYHNASPAWLDRLHQEHPPLGYLSKGWPLMRQADAYESPPHRSNQPDAEWGPSFPHALRAGADPTKALINSPFGDEAVIDAALSAVHAEKLGSDKVPDILSLSLSSTDLIGHEYGPESREMEDQIIRLDVQIARLLAAVDQSVGLDRTLVVLSADHGGCESPQHWEALGKAGGKITEDNVADAAREALNQKYGDSRFFLGVSSPYVFLKRDLIEQEKIPLSEVRRELAAALLQLDGVHSATPLDAPLPKDALGSLLVEAIHPERSGDVYIVPKRYTHFLQKPGLTATHGSPWDYDTHVPLLLAGPGIAPRENSTEVDVRMLVPTVAALLGIAPPATAEAHQLPTFE